MEPAGIPLRELLERVMRERDEAFIRILQDCTRGVVVPERPAPGSGPYLHYKRDQGTTLQPNDSIAGVQFFEPPK